MKVEENPPGANNKFSAKEFLRRNLKIVIALSLISTAMSVTSLVIAVTHMHGEDGGNINLGEMGFRTANENSSTKMHERQKRASDDVYALYCPWGEKDLLVYEWEIEQEKTLEEFDDYCQCNRKDMCRIDQYDEDLFCSSGPMQELMEKEQKSKHACVIHDICYKTERSKEKCDEEFIHNYKKLCRGSHKGRAISSGLGAASGAAVGAGAIAGSVVACAIPLINIIACPAAVVATTVGTTAVAVGAGAGAIAGAASDCNTGSIIIKNVLAHHGHINSASKCELCEGSAKSVYVDLSGSRSFGSDHQVHGSYILNTRGDENFGFRPVYKHVDRDIWLYFIPKNRRVMVAGYNSPAGGEWYIGQREIGQTHGWLEAKDTENGIPTQNWYEVGTTNKINVKITKTDEFGNRI